MAIGFCKQCDDETLQEADEAFRETLLKLGNEEWFQKYYIRRVRFADEPPRWETREDFKTAIDAVNTGAPLSDVSLTMLLAGCNETMQLQRWPAYRGKLGTVEVLISCIQNLVNEIAAKKRRENIH